MNERIMNGFFTRLKRHGGRQLLLCICLSVFTMVNVCAKSSAQTVTLRMKDATLLEVFKQLEKKSDYRFLYRSDEASAMKVKDLDMSNSSVSSVLDYCLANTGLGYEIDGKVTTDFPVTHLLEKAKPVFKTLPGWKCDIRGIKKYEELPENCRNYIEFIEKEIGYPITMISNGPGRDDIIFRSR